MKQKTISFEGAEQSSGAFDMRFLKYFFKCLFNFRDIKAAFTFLFNREIKAAFGKRLNLLGKLYRISYNVDCPHTQKEVLNYITTILTLPGDNRHCIIEAGCYKGGSTAKFSLAANLAGRELVVFDSFEGIPEHTEPHDLNIYGRPVTFSKGEYCGTLEEVKKNVGKYGSIANCRFIKGWFSDTLPLFRSKIASVYIDVDLAESVKCCLKHFFPLMIPGSMFYSHDGHLPLVIDVFNNDSFWENEVGCRKPHIEGLGQSKLISLRKMENN